MKQFDISLIDGHIIIKDGDNTLLLDTGAPVTVHAGGNFKFLDKEYVCPMDYVGVELTEISRLLGLEITTLLGIDILSEYQVLFDYANTQVSFNQEGFDIAGVPVPLTEFMGIPIVELEVAGETLSCFLDTGAKISYLPESVTASLISEGTAEDFYPGLGKFETPCFSIETKIAGQTFIAKYGNLPSLLQMSLMLGGVDGIIGFDFFNQCKIVLNLANRQLVVA